MTWKSYLCPQTVLVASSKYNKLIRVNEEFGKYKLLVNGSRQSGEYIKGLWQYTFKTFKLNSISNVNEILVLGVAGGTVVHLLREIFPDAKITGVDIDKAMIEIGNKYFGLSSIKNLNLINDDAFKYAKKTANQKTYFDLVVVDLFLGRKIPEFVLDQSFLKVLKTLLDSNGVLVINYLRELEYGQKSEELSKALGKVFAAISDAKIKRNRFFMARK